ncbi:hypothetical protein [Tsukamurella paurometabola]|uniref:Uncharacterized protein n=1 Tax=Tsukamurella paurometabola TaxID=2061 RepID=A0A3P8KHJ8_TSUPA|nr:hypothetical protein [Tsukamurella paurometabola]MBS4104325.1 hypothetical protein [Tsukamurella paurometabola]UEA82622.1 hypothetical protein LK411_20000 [Tsukamurella paurometabola]VDR39688.1 Uncharacterised protein [Tsukamurella paurometabola]
MPFVLEPEVAGGLGEGTVLDASVHPPIVSELEYEVAGWLGDDLIAGFPVYLVSPRLLAAMETARLTGFAVNPNCRVTVNEQVHAELNSSDVSTFTWIDIPGATSDDLHVTADLLLGVSDRAWEVFSQFTLRFCGIREADVDDGGGA